MKRFLTISLLFAASINLFANPIKSSQAAAIAQQFAENNGAIKNLPAIPYLTIIGKETNTPNAYVFVGEKGGYIVISADSRLSPVIAFSTQEKYHLNSPLDKMIRADLSVRLRNIELQSDKARQKVANDWTNFSNAASQNQRFQQWPAEGTTTTGGWTETQWHQDYPYNQFCPKKISTGQRSVAGCPATAMAQILYFHKDINSTRFNNTDRYHHNYTQSFWIDDAWETYDFLSFDSLNVYMDSIELRFETATKLSPQEQGALTLAAGFACKSVYDPAGSGTFSVNQAFAAYQRFGFEDAVLLNDSYSDEDIRLKMISNIKSALPVHLATVDVSNQYGHNVVCDGYRNDGFFRLNFGWGGQNDNWYNLPEGFPLSLTVFEGIVADINGVAGLPHALNLEVNPADIGAVVNGSGNYVDGKVISILAASVMGYTFTEWTGDEEDLALLTSTSSATSSFTMPDRPVTLTANYATTTYAITFVVQNTEQNPIEGATIHIDNITEDLITNQEGKAYINLSDYTYNFTVEASGYNEYSESFTVEGAAQTVIIDMQTVGVESMELATITVYPNPFNHSITLNASGTIKRVLITNILGQAVYEEKEIDSESHTIQCINIQNGYYIMFIELTNGQYTAREIIKN